MNKRENRIDSGDEMPRRQFIKRAGGMGAVVAMPELLSGVATAAEASRTEKMIGLQVGAVSFVDEGTEQVLDILQERGAGKLDRLSEVIGEVREQLRNE